MSVRYTFEASTDTVGFEKSMKSALATSLSIRCASRATCFQHPRAFNPRAFSKPYASSSSKRWQTRQGKDKFAVSARVQGLKSRAAFKLLEINEKYKLFQNGQTVVDLGYAPGSWSQVAVDRTSPDGRVVGIDIIPAQPPIGVSTIQGNFLSKAVQEEVTRFLRDSDHGRPKQQLFLSTAGDNKQLDEEGLEESSTGYSELNERPNGHLQVLDAPEARVDHLTRNGQDEAEGRVVDIVLSDMSAPWEQTAGFWNRSLSDPYYRMMNTSGMNFRDHAGSMDLCYAALHFGFDTLRTGGHLVCKFYQGSEDKALEMRLKSLFARVHREKPESSRSESREAYFVALRRKGAAKRHDVFGT